MGSVYARGTTLWIAYKDARGMRVCKSSGLRVGREREAQQILDEVERLVASGVEAPEPAPSPLAREPKEGRPAAREVTVKDFAERWLASRQGRIRSVGDEGSRLKKHVYPHIGDRPIASIRPRDIRDVVLALRAKPDLAPRTVRHVYALLNRLFKSAVVEELIAASPVVVEKGVLPKNVDKDPTWRATAIFTREEVVTMITDRRIPEPRRILYAIKFLSGVRHGEAAGLHWSDYDRDMQPLGRFRVSHQYDEQPLKTSVPREVPVHPVLARLLDGWHASGFCKALGRDPKPDDFIVPNRDFNTRTADAADDDFRDDLARVGLRRRRGHDSRRTFTTLAQVDGARRDILKVITHAPSTDDIVGVYTSFPWPVLCEQVSCVKIALPTSNVIPLPRKAPATGGGDDGTGSNQSGGAPNGDGAADEGVAAAPSGAREKKSRGALRAVAATAGATTVALSLAVAPIPQSSSVIPPGLEPGAYGLGRVSHPSYRDLPSALES